MGNYFERYHAPRQPGALRPIIEDPIAETRLPQAREELRGKTLGNQKTAQEIALDRQRADNDQIRLNMDLRDKGLEVGPDGRVRPVSSLDMNTLAQIRDEAHTNLGILDDLEKGSQKWFGTGFLAPTMSKFGGTNAAGQEAKATRLKATAALNKILEMAKTNGGKNPLTPMSNSDVDLMSNITGNLDVKQSDEDYRKSVKLYRDLYWKTFTAADDKIIAAGGKTKNPFRLKQQQAGPPKNAPRKSGVDDILKKYGVK